MARRSEIEIGVNQRRLHNDVVSGVRSGARAADPITIRASLPVGDLKKFSLPLGRITGDMDQFQSSLNASVARVLAFGASASVLSGVASAMRAVVESGMEVEKTLTEINTILNMSQSGLAKFSGAMFDVARNTSSSFKDVGSAALELSRQGLSSEETIKRLNDAMILARLSGIEASTAVDTLTASINGFAQEGVSSTEIVNRLASVDAAFAVSTKDLAEALSRAGAVAQDAGVSFNELISVVTAVQQQTARGGSIIGNGFKSIFTRIQRSGVRETLEGIGVSTTNSSGEFRGAIPILQDYAKAYDGLTDAQKSSTAEQIAGVYQINTLKAILKDMNKEYSVYSGALGVANGATDEAAQRMAELNQTTSALLQNTTTSLKEFGAALSGLAAEEGLRNILNVLNIVSSKMAEFLDEEKGNALARALMGGLGKFIAGPGLVIVGKALFTLLKFLGSQVASAFQQMQQLNAGKLQQQKIEQSITAAIRDSDTALAKIISSEGNRKVQEEIILGVIKEQAVALNQVRMAQEAISRAAASGIYAVGPAGHAVLKPKKASGFVPNFRTNPNDAAAEMMAAYSAGYKPGRVFNTRIHDGRGGSFTSTVNGAEDIRTVTGPNGKKGTFVIPPNAGSGFVPNFAGDFRSLLTKQAMTDKAVAADLLKKNLGMFPDRISSSKASLGFGALTGKEVNSIISKERGAANIASQAKRNIGIEKDAKGVNQLRFAAGKLSLIVPRKGGIKSSSAVYRDKDREIAPEAQSYALPIDIAGMNLPVKDKEANLEKQLEDNILRFTNAYTKRLSKSAPSIKSINEISNAGALKGIIGTVFETAIEQATKRDSKVSDVSPRNKSALIDFVGGQVTPELRSLFNGVQGDLEAKYSETLAPDVVRKAILGGYTNFNPLKTISRDGLSSGKKLKGKAFGYIPNFAGGNPLSEAISRERGAGVPASSIRVGTSSKLSNKNNPYGFGVTNTSDEPRGLSDVLGGGFVPNFALDINRFNSGGGYNGKIAQLEAVYADSIRAATRANYEEAAQKGRTAWTFKEVQKENIKTARWGDVLRQSANAAASSIKTAGSKFAASLGSGGRIGKFAEKAQGIGMLAGYTAAAAMEQKGGKIGDIGGGLSAGLQVSMIAGMINPVFGLVAGGVTGISVAALNLLSNTKELTKEMEGMSASLEKAKNGSSLYMQKTEELENAMSEGDSGKAQKIRKELSEILGSFDDVGFAQKMRNAGTSLKELENVAADFLSRKQENLNRQNIKIQSAKIEDIKNSDKLARAITLINPASYIVSAVEMALTGGRGDATTDSLLGLQRNKNQISAQEKTQWSLFSEAARKMSLDKELAGSIRGYISKSRTEDPIYSEKELMAGRELLPDDLIKNLTEGQVQALENAISLQVELQKKQIEIDGKTLELDKKTLAISQAANSIVKKNLSATRSNQKGLEFGTGIYEILQDEIKNRVKMSQTAGYASDYDVAAIGFSTDRETTEQKAKTNASGLISKAMEEIYGLGKNIRYGKEGESAMVVSGAFDSFQKLVTSGLSSAFKYNASGQFEGINLDVIQGQIQTLEKIIADGQQTNTEASLAEADAAQAQLTIMEGLLGKGEDMNSELKKIAVSSKIAEANMKKQKVAETIAGLSRDTLFRGSKDISELQKTISKMGSERAGEGNISALRSLNDMTSKFAGTDTGFSNLANFGLNQTTLLDNLEKMGMGFGLGGIDKKVALMGYGSAKLSGSYGYMGRLGERNAVSTDENGKLAVEQGGYVQIGERNATASEQLRRVIEKLGNDFNRLLPEIIRSSRNIANGVGTSRDYTNVSMGTYLTGGREVAKQALEEQSRSANVYNRALNRYQRNESLNTGLRPLEYEPNKTFGDYQREEEKKQSRVDSFNDMFKAWGMNIKGSKERSSFFDNETVKRLNITEGMSQQEKTEKLLKASQEDFMDIMSAFSMKESERLLSNISENTLKMADNMSGATSKGGQVEVNFTLPKISAKLVEIKGLKEYIKGELQPIADEIAEKILAGIKPPEEAYGEKPEPVN